MSEAFDPYHRWLGIPPKDQPPNHYRLLGIDLFEQDSEVIRDAAQRQAAHVRTYQLGPHSTESQKILGEIAAAQGCLLNHEKKAAYDARLKRQMGGAAPAEAPPRRSLPPVPSAPPPFAPVRVNTAVLERSTKSGAQKNNLAPYIGAGTAVVLLALLIAGYVVVTRDTMPPKSIAESDKSAAHGVESPAGPDASSSTSSQDGSRSEPSPPDAVPSPPEPSPTDEQNGSKAKPDTAASRPDARPGGSGTNKTDRGPSQSEIAGPRGKTSAQDNAQSTAGPKNGAIANDEKPNRNSPIGKQIEPSSEQKPVYLRRDFDLSLPSGNVLSSKLFDVTFKLDDDVLKASRNGLEKLKKSGYDVNFKDPYFDQGQQRFMYCDSVSGREYMILGECKTGFLDGDLMAYYNEQPPTPHIYAHYKRGKRDGIIRVWDRNGTNVYWCQHRNNSRQGFCCYFKDGALQIVYEVAPGKSARVYLCGKGGAITTFNSVDEAKSDKDARALIGELEKVDAQKSELKIIEDHAETAAHIPISAQTYSSRLKTQDNMKQREELKGVMERMIKAARSNGLE
jgi:hypothetical protein